MYQQKLRKKINVLILFVINLSDFISYHHLLLLVHHDHFHDNASDHEREDLF